MLIGVDTGGTFTDFVFVERGTLRIHKVPSTPSDPALAVARGLNEMLSGRKADLVAYGTTVATNALIERKGARTALITTTGFEDVIEIGRQAREKIHDINVTAPVSLVSRRLRFGVDERVREGGVIERRLSSWLVEKLARVLVKKNIESLAICFLNSYSNPANELAASKVLRRYFKHVFTSSEILPEYREYERFSTTCVNAYVAPLLSDHIERIARQLEGSRLFIMQSNGGLASKKHAKRMAVHSILSGPAAGALGALRIAKQAGFSRIITLDMGGTSTDVALCDGHLSTRTETVVGGCPIKAPTVDVHTVGAGGGSIAWIDRGGALRVGPQSAGAEPGPACYGKGNVATVTDANLLLGRLVPKYFLGGRMSIHPDRSREVIESLSRKLRLSEVETAGAILRVANANMIRAVRVVSVERGYDPSEFTLVCFGGAAPLHAAELARALSVKRVLIPLHPGVLSAKGLLSADIIRDYSQTLLMRVRGLEARSLARRFREMKKEAWHSLKKEGAIQEQMLWERYVDVRYVGQSYEITVPFDEDFENRFHRAHQKLHGHSMPQRETEIVNVRLRAIGRREYPRLKRLASLVRQSRPTHEARVYSGGEFSRTQAYDRRELSPGVRLKGPLLIVEESSTTYVPQGVSCLVDSHGNLVLSL
jgi:N-methylhydantoinase A